MNSIIRTLSESKAIQEEKMKEIQFELSTLENSLHDEIYKETRMLNKVLKHSLIEIINMIHKRGLKCSDVSNAETIWHDTVYTVSDGNYHAKIVAKNGNIAMDLTNTGNDGGGKSLYKEVQNLLDYDIIPFCEKEKTKYRE